jgi:hypothetical protein
MICISTKMAIFMRREMSHLVYRPPSAVSRSKESLADAYFERFPSPKIPELTNVKGKVKLSL